MTELKPCPICGAPAKILNWMNHSYVIECSKNDYQHCVYIRANSREEAIKQWNSQREETCDTVPYDELAKRCGACGTITFKSSIYCPGCGRRFV